MRVAAEQWGHLQAVHKSQHCVQGAGDWTAKTYFNFYQFFQLLVAF